MRHRIAGASHTGLGGNSSPAMISGMPTGDAQFDTIINSCAEDAYNTFFKGTELDLKYCEAGFDVHEIRFGIEPSYQYDDLKMICIHFDKDLSRFVTGRAWGSWGSDIAKKEKWYNQYKNQSKFVRFVDKWHPILFEKSC